MEKKATFQYRRRFYGVSYSSSCQKIQSNVVLDNINYVILVEWGLKEAYNADKLIVKSEARDLISAFNGGAAISTAPK